MSSDGGGSAASPPPTLMRMVVARWEAERGVFRRRRTQRRSGRRARARGVREAWSPCCPPQNNGDRRQVASENRCRARHDLVLVATALSHQCSLCSLPPPPSVQPATLNVARAASLTTLSEPTMGTSTTCSRSAAARSAQAVKKQAGPEGDVSPGSNYPGTKNLQEQSYGFGAFRQKFQTREGKSAYGVPIFDKKGNAQPGVPRQGARGDGEEVEEQREEPREAPQRDDLEGHLLPVVVRREEDWQRRAAAPHHSRYTLGATPPPASRRSPLRPRRTPQLARARPTTSRAARLRA